MWGGGRYAIYAEAWVRGEGVAVRDGEFSFLPLAEQEVVEGRVVVVQSVLYCLR